MDWKLLAIAIIITSFFWIDDLSPKKKAQPKVEETVITDEEAAEIAPLTNEEFEQLQDELRNGTKVQPPSEPEFIYYKKVNNRINENSFYADVINHDDNPFLTEDRDTNAHETTHGINSDIRNNIGGPGTNAFYVGNDKAVIIPEPKMKKSAAMEFIPVKIRSSRFELYFITNKDWENEPLYIFDEWTAYLNGSTVSIEDAEKGGKRGGTDAVRANLEFSIYALGVAMAVEKHDPSYWKENKQFKAYLRWSLKRSYDLFMRGKEYFPWDYPDGSQDVLLNDLRTAPEAEEMRKFLRANFDGIWLS